MMDIYSLLYISSSAGERAFVGLIIGLATAVLIGIISWLSSKKERTTQLKTQEENVVQLFIESRDDEYYQALIPGLMQLCAPSNYMKPYQFEKVKIANELYSLLQTPNLSTESIITIRNRAEKELGVQLSTKSLFTLLKESCNPNRFMNPYDAERVAKANELFNDILNNQNSFSELERIGLIARENGLLINPSKVIELQDNQGNNLFQDSNNDNPSQIVGKWIHPKGNQIRLVKTDNPILFFMEFCDDTGWHILSTLKIIDGVADNNGRGASFVDSKTQDKVYKISRWDTSLTIRSEDNEVIKLKSVQL